MATLPSATTRLVDQSSGIATGTDLIAVWSPVATQADKVWRLFSSSQDIYDLHGYAQGVDYSAMHVQAVKKPILFCGLPINSAGTVGRFDTSGNTDTSVVSIAVGSSGSLEETDGILNVVTGGTIGTTGIILEYSCDGGRNYKTLKLGTASTYTIPYFGLVISFAAGDLTAGDTVLTWHSTAPKPLAADIALAKTSLAAQMKQVRSWLMAWDMSTSGDQTGTQTAVNAFETTDERYCVALCALRDRNPQAAMSNTTVAMTGAPTLTFFDAGGASDTITRSAGSFITDGFANGDRITITGSVSNNLVDAPVVTVAATVLTLGTTALTNEGPKAGCTLTGTPTVTFAEAGASDTITRSRGSWYADGFRTGDLVTIDGTALNDQTTTVGVTITSALIMTMGDVADGLTAEAIGENLISITAGETDAQCIATLDAAFAACTTQKRMSLGYGRGAMTSPITGWQLRRNVVWPDSMLSYIRDICKTTWEKDFDPIATHLPCGFDLNDVDGQPYEHDERTTGGALAAGFTCARTWGNGPVGAFIAQSLTRQGDDTPLSMTHNMYVASLAQTVAQATTEKFCGKTLILKPADSLGVRVATAESLAMLAAKVNAELTAEILGNKGGEGARASQCYWTPAINDDLGKANATLHGTLTLELNGVIVHVETAVNVS